MAHIFYIYPAPGFGSVDGVPIERWEVCLQWYDGAAISTNHIAENPEAALTERIYREIASEAEARDVVARMAAQYKVKPRIKRFKSFEKYIGRQILLGRW